MKKLNKKDWKLIEEMYPYEVKCVYRTPISLIKNKARYELIVNELNKIESDKINMEYLGTYIGETKDRESYVEYYLKDDLLYTFLYAEKLEINESDNDEFDIYNTGLFELVFIVISNSVKDNEKMTN